jgi:hypothetical protein
VSACADFGCCDVTADLCQSDGLCGGWIVRGIDEIAGVGAGVREEPANDVRVIAAVVGHLGHGAFADVVIAGEAGVSGLMDGRGPELVVALRVAVGFGEPCL